MRKFVLEVPVLFAMIVVAMVLSVIQVAIYSATKDDPEVAANVTCAVQDTAVVENRVGLKMDCQGQEAVLKDSKVVVSYLKSPGPLTCTVYKSGKAKCQLGIK